MSTNNNKDKKSTDTKPKGEVKNINTTTKGLFDYHKEKKTKNSYLFFLNTPNIFSNRPGVVVFRFLISPTGLFDLRFLGDFLHEDKRITSFL